VKLKKEVQTSIANNSYNVLFLQKLTTKPEMSNRLHDLHFLKVHYLSSAGNIIRLFPSLSTPITRLNQSCYAKWTI